MASPLEAVREFAADPGPSPRASRARGRPERALRPQLPGGDLVLGEGESPGAPRELRSPGKVRRGLDDLGGTRDGAAASRGRGAGARPVGDRPRGLPGRWWPSAGGAGGPRNRCTREGHERARGRGRPGNRCGPYTPARPWSPGERPRGALLCAFHHLRCVHAGLLRCVGRAPDGLRWKMGIRPGVTPVLAYRSGDLRVPAQV